MLPLICFKIGIVNTNWHLLAVEAHKKTKTKEHKIAIIPI